MFPKQAAEADFEQYYKLRRDTDNIFWTGYITAPKKDQLFAWYLDNIKKNERYFFLFFLDEKYTDAAGYLYMDFLKSESDSIEVGYGVYSLCSGKGYGTEINKFAIGYTSQNFPHIKYLQAWIASDNIGSIQCVTRNGYYKTQDVKSVTFGSGEEKIFNKYVFAFGHLK